MKIEAPLTSKNWVFIVRKLYNGTKYSTLPHTSKPSILVILANKNKYFSIDKLIEKFTELFW